jgi:hypothetical protein
MLIAQGRDPGGFKKKNAGCKRVESVVDNPVVRWEFQSSENWTSMVCIRSRMIPVVKRFHICLCHYE